MVVLWGRWRRPRVAAECPLCNESALHLHGLHFDLPRIADACRRAGVLRAYLFGSILTDTFGPGSDIDILVETDPAHPAGLLALGGLQMDLTELLGRHVHLTMLGGMPQSDRANVLAHARMLHAA